MYLLSAAALDREKPWTGIFSSGNLYMQPMIHFKKLLKRNCNDIDLELEILYHDWYKPAINRSEHVINLGMLLIFKCH